MKCTLLSTALVAALGFSAGTAQAASFTYHGSLQDSGKPADGSYDIELTLYSAPSGGSVIGGPLIMHKVPVHGGSFSTEADFGPLAKSFSQAYVEVKVRTAGQGEFVSLDTRAQVTPETASVCPGAWTLQGNAGNPVGSYLGTADTQPLTFEVNGTQVGQITPSGDAAFTSAPKVVFGSSGNNVAGGIGGATIAGGGDTTTSCGFPSCANSVTADFATVGGGEGNTASGEYSIIAGGQINQARGKWSSVSGGSGNTASGTYSSVVGGASGVASGYGAVVAVGFDTNAGGDFSFAAGGFASVRDASQAGNSGTCLLGFNCGDYGTFIWNDDTGGASFTSTGPHQFLIHARGGVAINGTPTANGDELTIYGSGNGNNAVNMHLLPHGATLGFNVKSTGGSGSAPALQINQDITTSTTATRFDIATTGNIGLLGGDTSTNPFTVGTDATNGNGAFLSPGGVWTAGSSRTFKEDFAQIDAGSILAKVIQLPVQTWFYKNDHREGRHMGPVAEDFAALFGLGNDEKHIGGVDESGVAFAAIQGLNQKIEAARADEKAQLKEKSEALARENAELRSKLDDVLTRLSKLEAKQGE